METPSGRPGGSPLSREARLLEGLFPGRVQDGPPEGDRPPADGREREDGLLRDVFGNSRRLALGLSRHLGVTFETHDFRSMLADCGIPCFQGRWSAQGGAQVLERPGCAFASGAGHLACDYWREALDGLVTGLGDRERLARHACARHGDASCVDVLFADAGGKGEGPAAWGPLPDHLAMDLFEAAERFRRRTGITVELKGMNEGVLHYAFQGPTDARCGSSTPPAGPEPPAGPKRAAELFRESVLERFPGISLKDATPQAVLGTGNG